MVGSCREYSRSPREFHKDFNITDKILWESGTRAYSQIFSVELRSDPMLEFNWNSTVAYSPCVLLTPGAYSLLIKKMTFFSRNWHPIRYSESSWILPVGTILLDPVGLDVQDSFTWVSTSCLSLTPLDKKLIPSYTIVPAGHTHHRLMRNIDDTWLITISLWTIKAYKLILSLFTI